MRLAFRPGLFAIAAVAAIALAGCQTPKSEARDDHAIVVAPESHSGHPLTEDRPTFLRLSNTPDHTPVRIGLLLPFNSGTASVKALAAGMLKAAEMAVYDSHNRDIILMTADEGSTAADADIAARKLLNQGAEIIVGPLYATAVRAIASTTRDRAVPVLSFSTDRSVAGDGIYLMGFLPENDVRRVVTYAADHGRHKFTALVPRSAYGDLAFDAFKAALADTKSELGEVERFAPTEDGGIQPAMVIARADADAVFIPQGGAPLRAIAPSLGEAGLDPEKNKLLGTGIWNDPANLQAPSLAGAWFAAPDPRDDIAFNAKFRGVFGSNPPLLASLAYDAVAVVAALAKGEPYHRFTREALTDPNGFDGVDGIFRFNPDGTNERGLAILTIRRDGFRLVDPAPTTFVKPGS